MDSKKYDGTDYFSPSLSKKPFSPDVIVVGVGFVGLTLSMALCRKKLKVLGVDRNQELVKKLSLGFTNILEPGIDEILQESLRKNLFKLCIDNESVVREPEKPITFIMTVGTPIIDKKVENDALIRATEYILKFMRPGDLVILRSTVEIGTSRNIVLPILLRSNVNFYLAMCPERTVEGNALSEIAELPQIVGGIDEKSSIQAKNFFEMVCKRVLVLSSIESAELLKLANNTFRDLQFAFANEITLIAKRIGVSSSEVIKAANFDYERSTIPLPGPSGGPCLEKDPWILVESGQKLGVDLPISRASRIVNESSTLNFVLESIRKLRAKSTVQKIGILGLSFKGSPVVNDSRGSFSRYIMQSTELIDLNFCGYEPGGVVEGEFENLEICESIEEVLEKADTTIIATNFKGFANLIENMNPKMNVKTRLIIDMWNQIDPSKIPEGIEYWSWG